MAQFAQFSVEGDIADRAQQIGARNCFDRAPELETFAASAMCPSRSILPDDVIRAPKAVA
jgi:hypothetical protein